MRPTTKDLAKEAGVSLATIDRVLNNRPGVQRRTIDKVNKAIEKIGFVRNVSAANLARSKSYRLLFLLPYSGDQFLDRIIDGIEEANATLAAETVSTQVQRIPGDDPQAISEKLARISTETAEGVAILAPESPQVRDAMARVSERGVGVVSLISGQPSEAGGEFVGIDNFAAGATAGRLMGRFSGGRHGKIMVISETMQSRDSLERRTGFDAVITQDFPDLRALPTLETHGDRQRASRIIGTSYANNPDIVGLYVLSSEAREPLEIADELGLNKDAIVIAHERTSFTECSLQQSKVDAIIAQNPNRLVHSAIQILRALSDGRSTNLMHEGVRIEILLKENL